MHCSPCLTFHSRNRTTVPSLRRNSEISTAVVECVWDVAVDALEVLHRPISARNYRTRCSPKVTLLHDVRVRACGLGVEVFRGRSEFTFARLRTAGLIEDIYTRLEHFHGAKLVREVMALLNASRSGLSEKNLLDLISCDDNVLGK